MWTLLYVDMLERWGLIFVDLIKLYKQAITNGGNMVKFCKDVFDIYDKHRINKRVNKSFKRMACSPLLTPSLGACSINNDKLKEELKWQ